MIDYTVALFEALSDPNRVRILKCLQVRPACVCELVQALHTPQPRVSRHLGVLKAAGLVADARDAQWVEYSLPELDPDTPEAQLLAVLADWLEDHPGTLEDRRRLKSASRHKKAQV